MLLPVAISLFLLLYCQFFINVEFYYEEKRCLYMDQSGSNFKHYNELYFLFRPMVFVAAGYTTLMKLYRICSFIAILCSCVWKKEAVD